MGERGMREGRGIGERNERRERDRRGVGERGMREGRGIGEE